MDTGPVGRVRGSADAPNSRGGFPGECIPASTRSQGDVPSMAVDRADSLPRCGFPGERAPMYASALSQAHALSKSHFIAEGNVQGGENWRSEALVSFKCMSLRRAGRLREVLAEFRRHAV
eukprot:2433831-Alexandrium_andersonii.AAC.2